MTLSKSPHSSVVSKTRLFGYIKPSKFFNLNPHDSPPLAIVLWLWAPQLSPPHPPKVRVHSIGTTD